MPSVYNYRHVELDKVGRGKRVIQPPGGQTADIFGRAAANEQNTYSSASSQAGSDVASSRVHIETDQQSISGSIASSNQAPVDGLVKPQQSGNGQASPSGSVSSSVMTGVSGQQPLLMAEDFKPVQQFSNIQAATVQPSQVDATRTPKKTIPTLRRNPITGEVYENPAGAQQTTVRVRQPPGGKSSGIF